MMSLRNSFSRYKRRKWTQPWEKSNDTIRKSIAVLTPKNDLFNGKTDLFEKLGHLESGIFSDVPHVTNLR